MISPTSTTSTITKTTNTSCTTTACQETNILTSPSPKHDDVDGEVVVDKQKVAKRTTTTAPSKNTTNSTASTVTKSPSRKTSSRWKTDLWNFFEWVETNVLAVVAMLNIPPYSMSICFAFYVYWIWSTRSNPWMQTCLWTYLVYCWLDTRPQRQPTFANKSFVSKKVQEYSRRTWGALATAKYFQCQLHRTCSRPLDNKQGGYIFAYHPHGLISMGSNMALSTNSCNFDEIFPEIGENRSGVTLNATFWAPLYREYLLALGFCSANKSTLQRKLEGGESLILVPGGAAEALHAHPYNMKLSIRNRQGFIKLAIETKSQILPVIGFGENEMFDTLYFGKKLDQQDQQEPKDNTNKEAHPISPTTRKKTLRRLTSYVFSIPQESSHDHHHGWIWHFQHTLKERLSFAVPIWTHVLPKKVSIHVVVGAPVNFGNETSIEKCHAMYLKALTDLYEQHKYNYGYDHVPLEFV